MSEQDRATLADVLARDQERRANEVVTAVKVESFMNGVKALAFALREVLARKVTLGIIAEETAKAIFEDAGKVLEDAIDKLPEDTADGAK